MDMICPKCGAEEQVKVVDSRPTAGGNAVRRRRVCGGCGARFTTREAVVARRKERSVADMLREVGTAFIHLAKSMEAAPAKAADGPAPDAEKAGEIPVESAN